MKRLRRRVMVVVVAVLPSLGAAASAGDLCNQQTAFRSFIKGCDKKPKGSAPAAMVPDSGRGGGLSCAYLQDKVAYCERTIRDVRASPLMNAQEKADAIAKMERFRAHYSAQLSTCDGKGGGTTGDAAGRSGGGGEGSGGALAAAAGRAIDGARRESERANQKLDELAKKGIEFEYAPSRPAGSVGGPAPRGRHGARSVDLDDVGEAPAASSAAPSAASKRCPRNVRLRLHFDAIERGRLPARFDLALAYEFQDERGALLWKHEKRIAVPELPSLSRSDWVELHPTRAAPNTEAPALLRVVDLKGAVAIADLEVGGGFASQQRVPVAGLVTSTYQLRALPPVGANVVCGGGSASTAPVSWSGDSLTGEVEIAPASLGMPAGANVLFQVFLAGD